jgi:hypothetical protein
LLAGHRSTPPCGRGLVSASVNSAWTHALRTSHPGGRPLPACRPAAWRWRGCAKSAVTSSDGPLWESAGCMQPGLLRFAWCRPWKCEIACAAAAGCQGPVAKACRCSSSIRTL